MQVPTTITTGLLWQIMQSSVVLAAVALFFRLVLAPALMKLMRQELKPELDRLESHERAQQRVEDLVERIDALSGVPVTLARIEEQIRTLFKLKEFDRERVP